jgi:glycosyltransferase involved in cell wall biosynthesis
MPKQPLKILALVPYRIYPAQMGGQKGIALLYKYLSQVCSFQALGVQSNTKPTEYELHTVISDSRWRYMNPALFWMLRKHVIKNQPHFLLFEHPYFAWLILLCKWFMPYPCIVHSHNIESERFRSIGKWWWKGLWFYEKLAYRLANQVWFKTPEDQNFAIQHYGLLPNKTFVVPYGIEARQLPDALACQQARQFVLAEFGLATHTQILFFNGTLDYSPNLEALKHILFDIHPLLEKWSMDCAIIVCGKNLPAELEELQAFRSKQIFYAGFVEDIDLYFKACDLFLNPLLDGGGIKTKLVEALGFGKKAVSTVSGAFGVPEDKCGGRLSVVEDRNWPAFADAVKNLLHQTINNDHAAFYTYFSWPSIAEQIVKHLHNPFPKLAN